MTNASLHNVKTLKPALNAQHGTNTHTAAVSSCNDDIHTDSENQEKERLFKSCPNPSFHKMHSHHKILQDTLQNIKENH